MLPKHLKENGFFSTLGGFVPHILPVGGGCSLAGPVFPPDFQDRCCQSHLEVRLFPSAQVLRTLSPGGICPLAMVPYPCHPSLPDLLPVLWFALAYSSQNCSARPLTSPTHCCQGDLQECRPPRATLLVSRLSLSPWV